MFSKDRGFISHVHLGKEPWENIWTGQPLSTCSLMKTERSSLLERLLGFLPLVSLHTNFEVQNWVTLRLEPALSARNCYFIVFFLCLPHVLDCFPQLSLCSCWSWPVLWSQWDKTGWIKANKYSCWRLAVLTHQSLPHWPTFFPLNIDSLLQNAALCPKKWKRL